MDRPSERARPDDGLVWLGLLAWAAAGSPRVMGMLQARAFGLRDAIWAALFTAFGACLVGTLRSKGRRALTFAVAQSVLAMALPLAGMARFEGALPAIVAAELALVAPPKVAWLWLAGQGAVLFATIATLRNVADATRATAEYLAFGAFAMVLFGLRRKEREQRLDLSRINAELLATRAELADVVRRGEQTRIRRELHDGLGHALTVLSLQLDALAEGPSPSRAAAARAALDAVRTEARAAFSVEVGALDLESRIAALSAGIPAVSVRVTSPTPTDLKPEAAWVVLRCIQEALTNAWKHGKSREVNIHFHRTGGAVVTRIDSDGVPPAGPLRLGNGLRGMLDRACAIGGRVTFETDRGFAVVLSVPHEHASPAPSAEVAS